MAIIYSLICFGGRTGKTVTFTVSGSLVNLTNHGLRDGKGVAFTSTGTLPAGLTSGTTYYVRWVNVNAFTLHPTQADALANTNIIAFTTTGSGVHTVKGAYFLSLTSGQLARYGAAGSERIYDSIAAWNAARASGATEYDEEWAEVGEAFTERSTTVVQITIPSARNVITPTINGVVTEAFHGGQLFKGFIREQSSSAGNNLQLAAQKCYVEGITLQFSGSTSGYAVTSAAAGKVDSCILIGAFTDTGSGIGVTSVLSEFTNNIVVGFQHGTLISTYQQGALLANNLFTKNQRGVYTLGGSTSQVLGFYYNNISVGNTSLNWFTQAPQVERASNNAGASGDSPWVKGTGVTRTCSTSDFVDWTNNDFRLASGSALVDGGVSYAGWLSRDAAWKERPAYAGGAAEYVDVGPYERDLGYGPRPASAPITLKNVVVGSRILIESQDGAVVHYNADAATAEVTTTITKYGDSRDQWRIKVRKGSASPYYQPWETLATAIVGSQSIYVSQIPDE